MLRFTPSGAIRAPTSLQIRIGNTFDGRLRAGAPRPSRALTDAEVMENVHHFTEGSRGPRALGCDALVLSGVPARRIAAQSAALERARAWGVRHVTVHLPPGAEPRALDVDAVVAPLRAAAQAELLAGWRAHRTAVVPLDRRTLRELPALVEALRAAPPDRLVLSWPFPPAGPPAPAHEVVAAVQGLEARLAPLDWSLRGLPACLTGPFAGRVGTSRNRWYVDADHQRGAALLFFPDVLRFFKDEPCRFCARDAACDGVAEVWWRQGRVGRLRPL